MLALFFVVSGGVYFKYELEILRIVRKWYTHALLAAIYIAVEFLIPEMALCLVSMEEMNVLGMLVSLIGSVLLIEICSKLKENALLTFIGKNSIVFYFFSGAIPITLSVVLARLLTVQNAYGLIIVFVLSLLIGAVMAYFISNCIPWILDIRKLNKG